MLTFFLAGLLLEPILSEPFDADQIVLQALVVVDHLFQFVDPTDYYSVSVAVHLLDG